MLIRNHQLGWHSTTQPRPRSYLTSVLVCKFPCYLGQDQFTQAFIRYDGIGLNTV